MGERWAVANGKAVLESEAVVRAVSPAVLFGAGVFDTVKCGPGCLYWLGEHVDRLLGFSLELSIPVSRTRGEIIADAKLCLAKNPWGPAGLKILALLAAEDRADLFVVVAERGAYPPAVYTEGAALALSPTPQLERGGLSGKKTINYFERYIARRKTRAMDVLDWLYLDTRGHVAEGTFLNVFWAKKGAVYTPELATGILPGITRTVAISLLAREGIPVSEGAFPLEDLLSADEAFLTSSILEVAPLVRIDAHRVGKGTHGNIAKHLANLYRAERDARGTTRI